MPGEQHALAVPELLRTQIPVWEPGAFDLHADQLGPFGLIVLLQVIGEHEARRVLVRLGLNRSEELGRG